MSKEYPEFTLPDSVRIISYEEWVEELNTPTQTVEALRKENEQLRLAMIKCEQEADFALKQVSQTKICAAVRKIKELANTALKGSKI